jgi:hypothetical protein
MGKLKGKNGGNHPIHLRYMELYEKYSSSKNKINHLNELEGKITKERYRFLLEKHEAIINETEPQMVSLKGDIEKLIDTYTQELESFSKALKENKAKTEESDRLFNRGIIDQEQHEEDIAPLLAEKSSLERSYNKKSEELSTLKNSLIGSLKDGKYPETKLPVVAAPVAASTRTPRYAAKPLTYFYRFSSLFLLTQIIGIALFGLVSLAVFLKMPGAIHAVHWIGGIALLFTILFCLFKGRKSCFLTYFLTGLFFFAFALFVSSRLWDPQVASTNIWSIQFWSESYSSIRFWTFDYASKIEFLKFVAGWDMVAGGILFVLAIIRTFYVGLRSERAFNRG